MASKICFISPSAECTLLYREALARLPEPPLIVEGALAAAETVARVALEQGHDIFVTPEHNARYLWGRLNTPIVAIPLTDIVITQALHRARVEYGKPVAFFQFRYHYVHLSALKEILNCEIKEFIFHDEREGLSELRQAVLENCRAVVGGVVIASLAQQVGIPCVRLLPKAEDVLAAFNQAQQIASVRRMETREATKFKCVVQHSSTGVIVADERNKISVLNPAAERIFGITAGQAIGRSLNEAIPQVLPHVPQDNDQAQMQELKTINQRQLMVHRIPIIEEGKVFGTIFTIFEVSTIESMEERIRRASHTKGLAAKLTFQNIIGDSKIMRDTISRALRFAARDDTILITGESGTGKEVFAQSIHNASSRRAQPFVAVNCSAIPHSLLESELFGYAEGAFTGARRGGKRGVFELAHRGTIFLDEIGELSREAQGHLLRVLQEREVMRIGDGKVTPVDVRVIAATNKPLEQALQEGVFRWDLYYRLNVLQLRLPALKEHLEDVILMASAFVDKWCSNQHLAGQIKQILQKYESLLINFRWQGNVREVQNLIKRVVALVETMAGGSVEQEIKVLLEEMFSASPPFSARSAKGGGLKTKIADYERELILQHNKEHGGSKALLAKRLGIGRTTLWRKLNRPESK